MKKANYSVEVEFKGAKLTIGSELLYEYYNRETGECEYIDVLISEIKITNNGEVWISIEKVDKTDKRKMHYFYELDENCAFLNMSLFLKTPD